MVAGYCDGISSGIISRLFPFRVHSLLYWTRAIIHTLCLCLSAGNPLSVQRESPPCFKRSRKLE